MISVFGCKVGQEEKDLVCDVLDSQWLGLGKMVEQFESEFQKHNKIENFLMVDSGSNALYLSIKLLDLPPQSEIILPALTWVSAGQAVLLAGHIPVFADVDLETMNVTKEHIEPCITKNTGAIMVVHYAGKPVDLDPIIELGYPVIEDAAHAVVSKYKGKPCGGISDVGIFSFNATKNLATSEGGGISFRKKEMYDRAKVLRYCGIGKSGFENSMLDAGHKTRWWEYNILEPFIKMLPSNVSAAIALGQLRKIDELQQRRERIFNIYQENLTGMDWIVTPPNPAIWEKHSYFTYAIRTDNRDELAHYLLGNGIYTTLRFHPLHMIPLYKSKSVLPNTEELNKTSLCIPLHPNLSDNEVEFIIDKIRRFRH
ncbi:MAG TPA: DegT/DnrJ/EryC1/StrS family aminotransferase [Candidatus Cloacimonadota bacterium]|nr:DegT/DnrJ/EryC1/StrS family aminotransferase [Candidatus Cloacimonadota bacterium]